MKHEVIYYAGEDKERLMRFMSPMTTMFESLKQMLQTSSTAK